MKIKLRHVNIADFYSAIADGPHADSFARWDHVLQSEVEEYLDLLKHAKSERPMQAFFYLHRHFLVEHLRGGHGRWAISQLRLGSQHVTDFMIGASHSLGADWIAVELESPRASIFTKAGNPTATLTHAIRQITDWRAWLTSNLSYATRPVAEGGLGLDMNSICWMRIFSAEWRKVWRSCTVLSCRKHWRNACSNRRMPCAFLMIH